MPVILTISIISNFQKPLQHTEFIRWHTGVFHLFNTFLTHHSFIRIQSSMCRVPTSGWSIWPPCPTMGIDYWQFFLRHEHMALSSTCTQLPRKATPACHFLQWVKSRASCLVPTQAVLSGSPAALHFFVGTNYSIPLGWRDRNTSSPQITSHCSP